jgi:hypothetical protein
MFMVLNLKRKLVVNIVGTKGQKKLTVAGDFLEQILTPMEFSVIWVKNLPT